MTDHAQQELTVAIVGCGVIGVNHVHVVARQRRLRIVALVDAVPAAAERLADLAQSEIGIDRPATYSDLSDALKAQPIDLVVICTPSGLHVEQAETAIAAGAHVVIEKPLDVSLPRARRIAELAADAAKRGLVASVISQHRFDAASVVVARAAHGGAFGRITSAVATVPWWRSQQYYDSGQWRGTWELDGGGALMNQGVHTVDLLVWFLGRPVEISAQTGQLAHERIEVEDIAVATIRFESGALAVLHGTTAAFPGLPVRLQVHGSLGSAIIDDDRLAGYYIDPTGAGDPAIAAVDRSAEVVPAEELPGATPDSDGFVNGHARQYDDIVDAIDTGRQPGVNVQAALESLAVVRAVYASATLGRSVSFDDVLAGEYDELEITIGQPA